MISCFHHTKKDFGRWRSIHGPSDPGSDIADDGERRAEDVIADVLALDPEEPRVSRRRHLPQGVT